MPNNEFNLTQMNIQNIHSHYEVNLSNYKAELYEKIVSVKLFVIVIIDSSAIQEHIVSFKVDVSFVATFKNWKNIHPKIRVTTFNFESLWTYI